MRYIAIGLITLIVCTGCKLEPLTRHEKKMEKLTDEIEILRKEVRRANLQLKLERIEAREIEDEND